MSVELVTGYYGVGEGGEPKRHVSSAEDGARQAGTLGLGCYALSTGSKLSATMEDANTLVVADGDVVMNGRHVSLPDPTSFTIPTGVQGQKVSNIAALRYEKAADSVESVTPVVLTGEPSAGTPTDPAYNEGSILDGDSPVDMPLYRVITDGINAEDPEPLFDVLAPMAELRDLVSQVVWEGSATSLDVELPGVSRSRGLIFEFSVGGARVGAGACILSQGANVVSCWGFSGGRPTLCSLTFSLDGDRLSFAFADAAYYKFSISLGDPVTYVDGSASAVTKIASWQLLVSQRNVLTSQNYSDIAISAIEASGIVCISVRRQSGEATALTRTSDTVIGALAEGARPAKDVDAIAGVAGDGAWLLVGARTDGRIVMRHVYGSATELWASFSGSFAFSAS